MPGALPPVPGARPGSESPRSALAACAGAQGAACLCACVCVRAAPTVWQHACACVHLYPHSRSEGTSCCVQASQQVEIASRLARPCRARPVLRWTLYLRAGARDALHSFLRVMAATPFRKKIAARALLCRMPEGIHRRPSRLPTCIILVSLFHGAPDHPIQGAASAFRPQPLPAQRPAPGVLSGAQLLSSLTSGNGTSTEQHRFFAMRTESCCGVGCAAHFAELEGIRGRNQVPAHSVAIGAESAWTNNAARLQDAHQASGWSRLPID